MYWLGNARTLIWWRNLVVAPLSEEWTFRACMLPLLLQCFSPTTAIFICPLFFGVAHFHHVVERTKVGMEFKHAVILSSTFNYFTFCIIVNHFILTIIYLSLKLFNLYTQRYLEHTQLFYLLKQVCIFFFFYFILTNRIIILKFLGHFVAPFAAHSFCNHMGFPDLTEVMAYDNFFKRAGFFSLFVIGLVAWCYLLIPLTNPSWFNNNIFFDKNFIEFKT